MKKKYTKRENSEYVSEYLSWLKLEMQLRRSPLTDVDSVFNIVCIKR